MNSQVVLILLGLLAPLQRGEWSPYADVFRIKVVDSLGNPVSFTVLEFREKPGSGGPNLAQGFKGGAIHHLQSGTYQYRLAPEEGYLPVDGTAEVAVLSPYYGKESLLVVEAKRDLSHFNSALEYSPITVDGVIYGLPPNSADRTWISLVDAYSGEAVRQAPVDKAGHFAIGDLMTFGQFILVVCQESGIVAAQALRIDYPPTGGTFLEPTGDYQTLKVRIDVPAPQREPRPPFTTRLLGLFPMLGSCIFLLLLAGGYIGWWKRKRRNGNA